MVGVGYTDKLLDSLDINDSSKGFNTRVESIVRTGPISKITSASRDEAVRLQLVPECYKNYAFDRNRILDNMRKRNNLEKLPSIYESVFKKYASLCENILTGFRSGQVPNRSYIIGAPPDLGLTEFVTECILEMFTRGFRTVPYITLYELADVKSVQAKVLEMPVKLVNKNGMITENINEIPEFIKRPELIYGRYSFSEYMNSSCLFVHLSDVVYKEIESKLLKQILTIRGMKGLPTIVTVGISLDYYRKDKELEEYVWRDITTRDVDNRRFDMLYYVSCYRVDMSPIKQQSLLDEETGLLKG